MKPLSQALGILQGEKNMYMGYLLPVLYQLKNSLQNIAKEGLKLTNPLVDSIEAGINKRYFNEPQKCRTKKYNAIYVLFVDLA